MDPSSPVLGSCSLMSILTCVGAQGNLPSATLFVRSSHSSRYTMYLSLYNERTQISSIRLTKLRGLWVICPPIATYRLSAFCQASCSISTGMSPSTGSDGTTKLIFGLSVNGSMGSGFPFVSRSHRELTKLAMSHRSSTVVLSAKEGIGVPFTPVEKVRKMFWTLYGSWRLPRKFQHLCQSAGWIANPQSSFKLKALPSPRPSTPWHSMHFFSTINSEPRFLLS